jgi:chromosome segregation ATPase
MNTIEELEARLETVNVERDDLKQRLLDMVLQRNDVRDKLDICGLDLVMAKRERDEARAYAEDRNDEANKLQRLLNMAATERDEARAKVERLADERDELLVRVADAGAELRATREAYRDAYRRGVEAMREACANAFAEYEGAGLAAQILAIELPEGP